MLHVDSHVDIIKLACMYNLGGRNVAQWYVSSNSFWSGILLPALFDVRPCKLAPEKIMTKNFNVFPTQKIQKRLILTSPSPFQRMWPGFPSHHCTITLEANLKKKGGGRLNRCRFKWLYISSTPFNPRFRRKHMLMQCMHESYVC